MPEWKRLPDSELEIMLIIWEARGQISTSDIMQRLKKKKSLQLVQNSLNRLEGKGFVRCEKIGRLTTTRRWCRWRTTAPRRPATFSASSIRIPGQQAVCRAD